MKLRIWTLFLWLAVFGLFLTGCGNQPGLPDNQTALKKQPGPEVQGRILAKVNQTPIYAGDLDYALSSVFSDQKSGENDPEVRKQVLKSLVASRAVSQARLLEMTSEELKRLDQEVAAFREKRLVRQYVMKHAPPQPVSQRKMRDYYETHPQAFGADTITHYEMITSERRLTPSEQDRFMETMKHVPEAGAWNVWVEKMNKAGNQVAYRKGILKKEGDPELMKAVRALETGKRSDLIFIKDIPYVVRIVQVEQTPPLPFEDIKERIRQQLTADALKQSVSGISQKILSQADVVYETTE